MLSKMVSPSLWECQIKAGELHLQSPLSMPQMTYNLSKRKKRSTIGKNIQKKSAFG